MKIKSKKGIELSLNTIIWFTILGIFLIIVLVWYFGLRDYMVNITRGVLNK